MRTRSVLFGVAALALLSSVVLADIGGETIYFNFAGKIYTWNPVNGKLPVGDWTGTSNDASFWMWNPPGVRDFSNQGTDYFRDIAFDTDRQLYAVNQWDPGGGANTGSFWRVDPGTAEITYLASTFANSGSGGTENLADRITALANYDTHKFFAAVNGTWSTTDNPLYDSGHLYDLTLDPITGALTGLDVGRFKNAVNAGLDTLLTNPDPDNIKFVSTGDLWHRGGVLYGTITVQDAGSNEVMYLLASIDTTNAEVTVLANLDPWSKASFGADPDGTSGPLPKPPLMTTGHGSNLFQAMTDWNGNVALIREDGYLFYWNGDATQTNGTNILWTGVDVGCIDVRGGTAVPVPVPAALPLGVLGFVGLCLLGRKMRKLA